MPSKNTMREFEENGIYHVYNRGLAKRDIFTNNEDFGIFIYYLSAYLLDPEKTLQKYPDTPLRIYYKNLSKEVELLSYCLMPNHFHLLIKTRTKDGITKLLRQLTNAYTTYFNKKYDSEGPVFQGKYKAVRIRDNDQLIHVSRYIHLNPTTAFLVDNPKDYKWSSYNEYQKNKPEICSLSSVLGYFSSVDDWEKFVLDQKEYSRTLAQIKHLTLES